MVLKLARAALAWLPVLEDYAAAADALGVAGSADRTLGIPVCCTSQSPTQKSNLRKFGSTSGSRARIVRFWPSPPPRRRTASATQGNRSRDFWNKGAFVNPLATAASSEPRIAFALVAELRVGAGNGT